MISALRLFVLILVMAFVQIAWDTYIPLSKFTRAVSPGDEAEHLGAGLELLQHGSYGYERMQPPLGRAWAALPAYFLFDATVAKSSCEGQFTEWKNKIEAEHKQGYFPHYCLKTLGRNFVTRTTQHAGRIMQWPLYLLSLWAVYALARELKLPHESALLSAACLAAVPVAIFLAARIMLDMGLLCFGSLTLFAMQRLINRAQISNAVVLGLFAGLAGLTKFSAYYFLPPICMGWLLLAGYRQQRVAELICLSLVALAMVVLVTLIGWQGDVPAFQEGIQTLLLKQEEGHSGILFTGGQRHMGTWYFHIVSVLIKTPTLLLLVSALGSWRLLKERPEVGAQMLLAVFTLLALTFPSRIDVGVHHIILVYIPLSILGGYGMSKLLRYSNLHTGLAVAVLWMMTPSTTQSLEGNTVARLVIPAVLN